MKKSEKELTLSPQAFWDFDPSKLDFQNNVVYTILRVLERGTDNDVIELVGYYGDQTVKQVVNTSPELSPRARSTAQQLIKMNEIPRGRRLKRVRGHMVA